MAFPELILSGSTDYSRITGIGLAYDGDISGEPKPIYLNRMKYTVRRLLTKDNVNSGTPGFKQDVPYDYVRIAHNWVGYVDVLTQSVVLSNASTAQERTNVNLLRSAVILNDSAISYNYKKFNNSDLGIGNLSEGDSFYRGDDDSPAWVYKIVADTPTSISKWVIKETTITDNPNNTSRVTFTLEVIEVATKLSTIIDS
jgi:hypothetical protein